MAGLRVHPWHRSALLAPSRFFDVQGRPKLWRFLIDDLNLTSPILPSGTPLPTQPYTKQSEHNGPGKSPGTAYSCHPLNDREVRVVIAALRSLWVRGELSAPSANCIHSIRQCWSLCRRLQSNGARESSKYAFGTSALDAPVYLVEQLPNCGSLVKDTVTGGERGSRKRWKGGTPRTAFRWIDAFALGAPDRYPRDRRDEAWQNEWEDGKEDDGTTAGRG
ncbi:hypothetical protein BKA80DRAFT_256242 [Phyllosticta citrichinensis]